jgi:hypothetical protein
MWKIGNVQPGANGYGFNVTGDQRKPLVWFEYETEEEAKAARKQIEAAIERAVLVQPFAT